MVIVKKRMSSENVVQFLLNERLLTIAVLGSVVTFQFISTFKINIIDPLLDFALPSDKFNFMNIVLKDGEEQVMFERKISLGIGVFLKEFIKWIVAILMIYLLAKYTRFPRILGTTRGNYTGAAVM